MQSWLLGLTLVFAALNWLAVEFTWRRISFISKPCTMIFMIAWFSQAVGWEGAHLWFGLGLVFSLLGDLLLLFPERLFLPGLFSFLLTHLCYIIGFNQTPIPLHPLGLVFLAGLVGLDSWLMKRLLSTSSGRDMALPVTIYMATISIMALSALLCVLRPEWRLPGALAAGLGAVLFLISDSVLAYNRFVAPTRHNDLVVMATYHLAQIGIVLGLFLK